ncbi:hypothetical protein FRC12_000578, partial [Ceratobasidium sp. 428]
SLICGEIGGQEKLHDMLRFAQDLAGCRKLLFANYFSSSSALSLSSWTTEANGRLTACGHCDNCTRPPETVCNKDVTLDAWIILRVAQTVDNEGGRVTVGMLADLVRGVGGQAFQVPSGGRKRRKSAGEKVGLDLNEVTGGKTTLSKDDAETLIIQLVLSGHLKEIFHSTAYSINVYLQPGPQAIRLTRLDRDAVEAGGAPKIECTFLQRKSSGRAKAAGKGQTQANKSKSKGKSKATTPEEDAEDFTPQMDEEIADTDTDQPEEPTSGRSYQVNGEKSSATPGALPQALISKSQHAAPKIRKRRKMIIDDDEDDSEDDVIVLSP